MIPALASLPAAASGLGKVMVATTAVGMASQGLTSIATTGTQIHTGWVGVKLKETMGLADLSSIVKVPAG